MNQSMNDEAVCRTAPATPGLLNMDMIVDGGRPFPASQGFVVSTTLSLTLVLSSVSVFKIKSFSLAQNHLGI